MTTYNDSGVNIELGDDASKILYEAAKITWQNRKGRIGEVIELFSDFSGLRAIHIGGLPKDTYMNMGFDGVGTKAELAERRTKHDTVAFDLFAMVCDDAVVRGAEPVLLGSILDVKSLGKYGKSYLDFMKQLAHGYIAAAKEANVAVVNGELAELGSRVQGYGDFNYNWGAGIVWFARKDRLITGYNMTPGDTIVALREEGFRSNGLSLLRKVMKDNYGDEWHKYKHNEISLIDSALLPSQIYSAAVAEMFGGYEGESKAKINGIAHITGGGIPGKLGRTLKPSGLGAIINPYQPCELMLHCQDIGHITDKEAYKTWNMGQGMLIITPEPEKIMEVADKYNIESRNIGQTTRYPGIKIWSKGRFSKELIEF
jgi:phosphoribosylformylglycinamidine cyclo-ligase